MWGPELAGVEWMAPASPQPAWVPELAVVASLPLKPDRHFRVEEEARRRTTASAHATVVAAVGVHTGTAHMDPGVDVHMVMEETLHSFWRLDQVPAAEPVLTKEL